MDTDDPPKFPLVKTTMLKKPLLFGVFDGMGGEECGEVASLIAAKQASLPLDMSDPVLTLADLCKDANAEICKYASEHGISSMGTTAAMLLFSKRSITLCNIGDSKVFLFSDGRMEQISEDHIGPAPFGRKPPLSQNLGIPPEEMIIEPYLSKRVHVTDSRFLICSDGVTDMLTNDEIASIIATASIAEASTRLIDAALERGGKDNATAILIEVKKKSLFSCFINNKGDRQK